MNSHWIEHQARQHIGELARDARGDQLATSDPADSSERSAQSRLGDAAWVPALMARLRGVVSRSRRDVARAR